MSSEAGGKQAKFRCVSCGSTEVFALIGGKPYCFKCGAKLIRKHMIDVLNNLKKEGHVPPEVEIPSE